MYKSTIHIVITIVSAFLFSCSSSENGMKESPIPNTHNLFSPDELKSDLTILITKTAEIHPDIYFTIDSAAFAGEVSAIAKKLDHPMIRSEYYKIVAPLLALLHDAHTSVLMPREDWDRFRDKGGMAFPFFVRFIDSTGVTVERNLDSTNDIAKSTKIVKINSLSVDSLFNEFRKYIGTERPPYNSFITANNFRCYLWLNNIVAPFSITLQSSESSQPMTLFSGGVPKQQIDYKPYEYKLLPGNTGYLIYNLMRNNPSEPFDQFLDTVFHDLEISQRKGLIVDLRENGGGSDEFVYDLLKHMSAKPFRACSKLYRKVSREYKERFRSYAPSYLRWLMYPPAVWLGAWCFDELKIFTASEGELLERHFEPEEYTVGPDYFKGKVCFLIGTKTFSSAVDLADAVKTYRLATVIGDETGGIPTAFGDRVEFRLPNTGLAVSVASAKFIRADGDELSRSGILPDIEVHESISDIKNNSDPVLDKAKEWILN